MMEWAVRFCRHAATWGVGAACRRPNVDRLCRMTNRQVCYLYKTAKCRTVMSLPALKCCPPAPLGAPAHPKCCKVCGAGLLSLQMGSERCQSEESLACFYSDLAASEM